MKRNWLILLALAAIITVPPIATGYRYPFLATRAV
jgi:hypothetical protein